MTSAPKGKSKSAGKGANPVALASRMRGVASRMRALADRLGSGAAIPEELLGEVVAALEGWESRLESQTTQPLNSQPWGANLPLQPPLPLPSPSGGNDAGAGGVADTTLIRIWCDGSCAPNPGAGGWGAIVEKDGVREELSGGARECTNNIMEMTAAIEALRQTPEGASVLVTTDSKYVKNGITKWIHGWKRRGWRKADGGAVLNQQLWRELDVLTAARRVEWAWIKGHSGHAENDRCDELANQARLAQSS